MTKSAPIPAAKRMAAMRERRKKAKLARLEIWARPEHHPAIKAAARKIDAENPREGEE